MALLKPKPKVSANKPRQEDLKFKVSWAIYQDPVSKNQTNKKTPPPPQ
jgi:hypothetical protein